MTDHQAQKHASQPVDIKIFRWAGKWGPFSIKIPCGECALTGDIVKDALENELEGVPVRLELREWLSEWWKPLMRGGWHAPIVMVENQVISQGEALNRGILTQAVIDAHTPRAELTGNHLFGKESCPHCQNAKKRLQAKQIDFRYHDVVKSPSALYEMIARVKPIIGPKTPVTVPQIWLEGSYVGGDAELRKVL